MKFRLATFVVTTATLASLNAVPAANAANASPTPAIPLLTVGTTFPMNTFNPANDGYGAWVAGLSLETLLDFSRGGGLVPNLATSWSQPNPVTYIYHLRHGVTFWDGQPLTSADVVYSMEFERAPGAATNYGYASVKSIAPDGPYTVVVTLKRADPTWKYTPAQSTSEIFEMKFAQAHKGTFGEPGVLVMGTGPWEIDSLDPTTGVELSANPNWWGGTVPIQHISYKFFANDTSAELAFRAGEIDLDPFVDGPKSFAAGSGAKILAVPSACTNALLSMNTQVAPWSDVHVRRAVAYALNRTDIITAEGGYASPYYTFIPPEYLDEIASHAQVEALLNSLPLYPYNLAKAKQEMAESAYPHGFSAPLVVFVYGTVVNTGEAIAGELQKIGINLQVKAVTLNAWGSEISDTPSQRPTTYFTTGCTSPDPSGYDWLLGSQNLKIGEDNVADYAPRKVDALLNQGLAAPTPAERFAVYSKLLQNLGTDVPYIPLFLHDDCVALSSRFTFPGFNAYFNGVYGNLALGMLDIRPAQ